ncbi:MAG: UDP-N-acetylglucosamine 2-epimerase (non-hydrolyzing) [Sphingomicrobium sp.]
MGTRPEAIKLSPIAAALARRGLAPLLVFTGQHPGLEPAGFGLGDFPSLTFACPGRADPDAHVEQVRAALGAAMAPPPTLIIVQGDTSSALGAALAGFEAKVAVAHVEAGLRTHDLASPWPEEGYRTAIDAAATLLFAPTDLAAANLAAENPPGAVFVTGNSGIDATLAAEALLPPPSLRETGKRVLLVTCHRRESWGAGLAGIALALRAIADRGTAAVRFVLHPNRHVAAVMRELLGGRAGIALIPPCNHAAMLQQMREADLIVSDSGGIQEEAPALGVPLLVLRDKTERPEGLASGNSLLVGTDPERIMAEVERLLGDPVALALMSRRAFPFGDGLSSPRIAGLIEEWLAEKRLRV